MNPPLQTRIRDTVYGKQGVVIAYTSAGVPVVEWSAGGVSTFEGEYETVEVERFTCAECKQPIARAEVVLSRYRLSYHAECIPDAYIMNGCD